VVLPQIRAFQSKGKLVIVKPQRRMGCGALMPEYSFTLDHRPQEQWRVISGKWRAKTAASGRTVRTRTEQCSPIYKLGIRRVTPGSLAGALFLWQGWNKLHL